MNEVNEFRIEKIKEYRRKNNVPEFSNPEEYHTWLKTPEGKAYSKELEKIRDEANIKDGQGDLIPNVYIFENDESVCEAHLELVNKPKYRVMIEVDSDYTDLQSMAIWNEDTGIIEQWVGDFDEAQQYIKDNGVWACDSSNEEECEY